MSEGPTSIEPSADAVGAESRPGSETVAPERSNAQPAGEGPPDTPQPNRQRATPGRSRRALRAFGLGLITGAADDDPSAIGTFASAGAKFGPSFLWAAPVAFPMMIAVVYLSGKLGQVSGQGLFALLRTHYPKWLLYSTLTAVLIGNVIEAGADIGGMAAAIRLLVPVPLALVVVPITAGILVFQIWGSYTLLRNIFRWLSLALLAYVASAFLAKPEWFGVLRATFVPKMYWNREYLSLVVAVIGTSLSAYLYTWKSNEEVEEKIAHGEVELGQRRGTTSTQLERSAWDVAIGMFFSSAIMYFVVLSTASTLFKAGRHDIDSAAQAAAALEPLAGHLAGVLFAVGIIGVAFIAIPVMTTGAAYDLCQSVGWKHGLHAKPREAKRFYLAITGFTALAMGLNFIGINPMKALVFAGIVQGFSTPFLLVLIMRMSNDRRVVGEMVNSRVVNWVGWATTLATFAATAGLVVTWFM